MSGIGAVTPATTHRPVQEGQQAPERDGRKRPPRPPRKPDSSDDTIEVEVHKLDFEV
jgi:hypothetical protein